MLKKMYVRVDSQEEKENLRNNRKTLKVLQHTAGKENLVGRIITDKENKLAEPKRIKVEDKSVQTEKGVVTTDDLTSEEPSADYWRLLAEKREEQLNVSLQENEHLKEVIESLTEENKICKESLDEAKALVEVLKEMLGDDDDELDTTEVGVEATEQ